MNNELFRKKNMRQLSSPEELNDYIHVTNPGLWILMAAIITFLVGVCVWGAVAEVTTVVQTAAVSDGQSVICYVKEEDISYVETGMTAYINDEAYTVSAVDSVPFTVREDNLNEYALRVGDLSIGEWVYPVTLTGDAVTDGVYDVEIIVDRISPFYFVFN